MTMHEHTPDDRVQSEPVGARLSPLPQRDDTRAVSPVIGAVLMFGLLLALLAVLQTTAIPALNEQLEFQHNERVQDDVVALDDTVTRVGATGRRGVATVEAGLRYPPRLFFVNPSPPAGTVRTTAPGDIRIVNATAAGETRDRWGGGSRSFETRALEYVPGYNEYGSAPVTVYEPWVVYNRFDERQVAQTEQTLVDGRRVSFVALRGARGSARADDLSIGVKPTSAPVQTVTVRDGTGPVTLTVPTRLREDEWADLLESEFDPDGDPDDGRYVTGFDCRRAPPAPCGRLTVTLQQGATYELGLGAVGVGSGGGVESASYLTDVDGNATAVPEGGRQQLVVEARDRFDNPVSGVRVTGTVEGDGTVSGVTPVTDAAGRAVFVYDAPETVDRTGDVNVTLQFGEPPREQVVFDIRTTGGGDTAQGRAAVTITGVDANLAGNQDRFGVSAEAAGFGTGTERFEFELRDPDTDTILDRQTVTVRDGSGTATGQVRASQDEQLGAYRLVVIAVGADGAVARDERTVDGSG